MITDTNRVVQQALDLLHLTSVPATNITVTEAVLDENILPGVQVGSVLKIKLRDVALQYRLDGRIGTNPYVNSVELAISKTTGQMVRLTTIWPTNIMGTPFPSIESYERQLPGWEPTFTGLPSGPPNVDFLDVLGKSTSAWNAKQVVVFYIMGTFPLGGIPPTLLYVVHVFGIPPIPLALPALKPGTPPLSPEVIAKAQAHRTYKRTIINAATGAWMRSDGLPNPNQ